MNKRIKTKWLKALRSGYYKQARGVLRNGLTGRYCCIGVLARVQGCPIEKINNKRTSVPPHGYTAGIRLGAFSRLVNLNDNHRMSFRKIAKWIEEKL